MRILIPVIPEKSEAQNRRDNHYQRQGSSKRAQPSEHEEVSHSGTAGVPAGILRAETSTKSPIAHGAKRHIDGAGWYARECCPWRDLRSSDVGEDAGATYRTASV